MAAPGMFERGNTDVDIRRTQVAEYYGETLQSAADLKTSACCPLGSTPAAHRDVASRIHPEIRDRFYGCGSPIPDLLEGATVLDLGCGTGRDVYIASALVGKEGKVIGIDMTEKQLEIAKKHQQFHAEAFLGQGVESNVDFRKAVIEDLHSAGIEDDSVDVVISNCVLNLSDDKKSVFEEIWRVLREGGELYFADIYADRRLPPEAEDDPVLVGECLGGALYIEDFRRIMAAVGFRDLRIVSSAPVKVTEERLKTLVPDVNFFSITFRAFKLPGLEDRAEDYGQIATYTNDAVSCKLDALFAFSFGTPVSVDGNTAMILQSTRYKRDFTVTPRGSHKGLSRPEMERGAIGTLALASITRSAAKKSEAAGDQCCATTSPMAAPAVVGAACCGSSSGQDEIKLPAKGPCCTPEQKSVAIAAGAKCCGISESAATRSASVTAGAAGDQCCATTSPKTVPSGVGVACCGSSGQDEIKLPAKGPCCTPEH
jgi:arsenite methyltransferase